MQQKAGRVRQVHVLKQGNGCWMWRGVGRRFLNSRTQWGREKWIKFDHHRRRSANAKENVIRT